MNTVSVIRLAGKASQVFLRLKCLTRNFGNLSLAQLKQQSTLALSNDVKEDEDSNGKRNY